MNKKELISIVAKKSDLTLTQSQAAIEAVCNTVIEELKSGEEVRLNGFGTFKARTRKARIVRNPATGEQRQMPESVYPHFKFSKEVQI